MFMPLCLFGYQSPIISDLQNGNVMNTQLNFMVADSLARPLMNFVPFFNTSCYTYPDFGGQINYPSIFSTGYQLDFNPPQTTNQWSWGNWMQNPLNSWMQGANGNNNNNNNTPATAEERELKTKIDKLESLLKQIADSEYAGLDISNEINDAINDSASKETIQAKYDALLEALRSLDRDVVRSFMVQARLSTDPNSGECVTDLLRVAGYEDGDEKRTRDGDIARAGALDSIENWIENSLDSDGNLTEAPILTQLRTNHYSVLDLVSAWNTQKDKSIIEAFSDKYKELRGTRQRDFFAASVEMLTNALIQEANEIIKVKINGKYAIDQNSGIKDMIKDLRDAKDAVKNANEDEKDLSTLAAEFDKLYATLRRAETKIAQTKVQNYFGFLDEGAEAGSKIFDDSLFLEDTENDLEAEGLGGVGSDVTLNNGTRRPGGSGRREDETPLETATRRLDSMTEYLVKNSDGTYTEKRPGGDDTTARTFTVNEEGKLVDNEGKEVTVDSVRADINEAKKKAEKTAKAEEYYLTSEDKEDAKEIAITLSKRLRAYTDWVEAEDLLDKIDDKNVLEVLKQYNKKVRHGKHCKISFRNFHHIWEKNHGFFRQLITECGTDHENEVYADNILGLLIQNLEARKDSLDETTARELQGKIDRLKKIKGQPLDRDNCCKLDKYVDQIYALLN